MEVSLQDAFVDIGAVTATFTLGDMRRVGRDQGGVLSPTEYGTRLWSGSIVVNPKYHHQMEILQAQLHAMTAADGTFLICPPARVRSVEVLGEILAIDANDRRVLVLGGASNLDVGDWVGINYAGGKRGLHQIYQRTGSNFQVQPPLALGVDVGDVATYGRPSIRAIVNPGSYGAPTFRLLVASGVSFEWTQTLRADG